ncbi:MAG: hypothetical protein U0271_04630 [Polyangiaceae bacterium]
MPRAVWCAEVFDLHRSHVLAVAILATTHAACHEVPAPAAPASAAPQTSDATGDATAQPLPPSPLAFGPEKDFALPTVPTVPALELPAVTLTRVDPALLQKRRAAERADTLLGLSPDARAEAWDALADYSPDDNPYRAFALDRAALWRASADATSLRQVKLQSLADKFLADRKARDDFFATAAPPDQRASVQRAFETAYAPYLEELTALVPPTPNAAGTPENTPPKPVKTPLEDPTGPGTVLGQRVAIKTVFGAHAQSFSVDTDDDLMRSAGGEGKPTFDVSGFYAGGEVVANVAYESQFAIGLLAFGRYHVTGSYPDSHFTTDNGGLTTLTPPDDSQAGAFVVGAGARFSGDIAERIAIQLGIELGYLQILPPSEVPGCGLAGTEWDPTMQGFQGDLFVGWEFYPISILSFGIAAHVGFGHVQGEWCVPGAAIDPTSSGVDDAPMDVSADSFSAGAQGEVTLHF